MGGRCAEELVFGEITSGASNDIERATSLAKSMVCSWGMSEKLGPINYHKEQTGPYSAPGSGSSYSEKKSEEIDDEIFRLINENYEVAMNILKEKRDALDRIAEGLIIWETLDNNQIRDLADGIDIGVPIIEEKPVVSEPTPEAVKVKDEDSSDKGSEPVIA